MLWCVFKCALFSSKLTKATHQNRTATIDTMKTVQQLASIRLAQNLKKVVRLALITYSRQSSFYRKCNTLEKHVLRMVNHFYLGFLAEVKFEQEQERVLNVLNVIEVRKNFVPFPIPKPSLNS